MAAVAELPALLNDSEQVRELIVGQPGVIDALVKVEGLGRALRASPNLVAFLARRPEYITLIRNNPSLLRGIRKNRGILPAIVDNPELGKALSLNPALVDGLTPKGLRQLQSWSRLVTMLSEVQAQLTVESWQSVLLDTDLLEFLDSHPDFALQFVSDPNIVGFYQQAPGHFVATIKRQAGNSRGFSPSREQLQELSRGPVPGQAPGPTGREPAPGVVSRERGLVDWINESEELHGLLQGTGGAAVVQALADHAELLPLMLALPDIANQLIEQPERVHGYVFRDFLEQHDPLPASDKPFDKAFDKAFGVYLREKDLWLPAQWLPAVRDAALITWSRVLAERSAKRAREQSERHERLSGLQPHHSHTWTTSGRIHYGKQARWEGWLNDQRIEVLERVATQQAVRGPTSAIKLHVPLHAHTDGGKGGVSFTYVVADDGKVDLLVYSFSTTRSSGGNDYQWAGNRSVWTRGPLSVDAAKGEDIYRASVALVNHWGKDRPAVTATHSGPAAAAATPSQHVPSQPTDPNAPLREAILTYYRAKQAVGDTAAASAAPPPRQPAPGKASKKKKKPKRGPANPTPERTAAEQ